MTAKHTFATIALLLAVTQILHGAGTKRGADSAQQTSPIPPPDCWDEWECAGQPYGDATCDGWVNLADLFALKEHFGKSAPWIDPECCADFNHDNYVSLGDLFIIKQYFGTGPYSPSTGNQTCPP